MVLPDFLTEADGEIRLTGHRIGLEHLIDAYNEGETAEMLALRYPTLPLSLVHHVIAFYLEHQADVDAYVAACAREVARQRAEGRVLDVAALRARLASRKLPASSSEVP